MAIEVSKVYEHTICHIMTFSLSRTFRESRFAARRNTERAKGSKLADLYKC